MKKWNKVKLKIAVIIYRIYYIHMHILIIDLKIL